MRTVRPLNFALCVYPSQFAPRRCPSTDKPSAVCASCCSFMYSGSSGSGSSSPTVSSPSSASSVSSVSSVSSAASVSSVSSVSSAVSVSSTTSVSSVSSVSSAASVSSAVSVSSVSFTVVSVFSAASVSLVSPAASVSSTVVSVSFPDSVSAFFISCVTVSAASVGIFSCAYTCAWPTPRSSTITMANTAANVLFISIILFFLCSVTDNVSWSVFYFHVDLTDILSKHTDAD